MDKKKLSLLLAFAIVTIVGIYYLLAEGKPANADLYIAVLETTGHKEYISQIADRITETVMKNNPIELNISLIVAGQKNTSDIHMRMKPGENESNWKATIKKSILSVLTDSNNNSLSNQSANDIVSQLVQKVKSENSKDGCFFVLTGAFPTCYHKSDAEEMTKQLKDSNFVFNKNNVLIWNVIDTRTAELEVLKSLSFATDERIVFDKPRICSDTASTRVFCMFFDKANGEKGPEFMQFLKNSYGGSLALTIWNDGKNNNASIPVNFADTTSVTQATKLLSSLDKGQWTSIGFLLKQAVNHLKQLPEGDEKRLVVYGNVPDEGKGSQLDPNTWKNLVGVKNLKIYKFLPKGSRKRENDKNFIFGLKYYKLNYIEN